MSPRIYRKVTQDGWTSISGQPLDDELGVLGPDWRPATRWEAIRYAIIRERFSFLEVVIYFLIADGISRLLGFVR